MKPRPSTRAPRGCGTLSPTIRRLAADLRAYMRLRAGGGRRAPTPPRSARSTSSARKLSPYGLALLGLALELAKDARAGEIAAALEAAAQQDQEQAWWPATRDQMLDFSEDATPEATAYAVKFLSHQRPAQRAAAQGRAVADEPSQRRLLVVLHQADRHGDLRAHRFPEDRERAESQPHRHGLCERSRRAYPQVRPGHGPRQSRHRYSTKASSTPRVNHMRVTTSGQGRLYYSTRAEYYSTDDKLQKTGIRRPQRCCASTSTWCRCRKARRSSMTPRRSTGPVAAGDTLAVRLTVTGSEWKYLHAGGSHSRRDGVYRARQRLRVTPAPARGGASASRAANCTTTAWPSSRPGSRRASTQYFYLLKVVNPGAFHISPARVQPMYQPGLLATTESRRLEVK